MVYLQFARRVDPECSHYKNCDSNVFMDMLINLIVVIMSQCTYILNHQVVRFKYTQVVFVNTAMKLKKWYLRNFNSLDCPHHKMIHLQSNRYYISHCILIL